MDTELLTSEEVAEFLKVPESTIRYWTMRREIPFLKIGKYTRYEKSEVLKWLEKKLVKPIDRKKIKLENFL